jgi:hypothetical protein
MKELDPVCDLISSVDHRLDVDTLLAIVTHTCNPSIWKAETGGWRVKHSLGYGVRACLQKNKIKKHQQQILGTSWEEQTRVRCQLLRAGQRENM